MCVGSGICVSEEQPNALLLPLLSSRLSVRSSASEDRDASSRREGHSFTDHSQDDASL